MPILPLVEAGELVVTVSAISILDIDTESRVLTTRVRSRAAPLRAGWGWGLSERRDCNKAPPCATKHL